MCLEFRSGDSIFPHPNGAVRSDCVNDSTMSHDSPLTPATSSSTCCRSGTQSMGFLSRRTRLTVVSSLLSPVLASVGTPRSPHKQPIPRQPPPHIILLFLYLPCGSRGPEDSLRRPTTLGSPQSRNVTARSIHLTIRSAHWLRRNTSSVQPRRFAKYLQTASTYESCPTSMPPSNRYMTWSPKRYLIRLGRDNQT